MEIINGVDQDDVSGANIEHNDLGGLNVGDYKHLTSANHTDLTDSGVCSIHKHDIVEDTTPQLGGNLDMQTNKLVGEGGSSGVYVDDAGNVGIGTDVPLSPLHVDGKGAFGDSITASNSIRALNLVSTDAVMRVMRIHELYGSGLELISRETDDGANTAFWDIYIDVVTANLNFRDRHNGDTNRLTLQHTTGNIGISVDTPTTKIDINGDKIRLRTAKTPATAGADGNQGDIAWDANYLYVCTATNTWKRSGLSTW